MTHHGGRDAQQRRYQDNAAQQRAYRARQVQARRAEQQALGLPPAPLLPTLPSSARWPALLPQARLALETVRDEMQAYDDDRSEAWQQGARAAVLAEQIDHLEVVLTELEAAPLG